MNQHTDNEAVLCQLLTEIELDSAIKRLKRIGFKTISSAQKHHLRRQVNKDMVDDIFIELNKDKHLKVRFARNAMLPPDIEVIATWDEWVCFVRLLIVQPRLSRHASIQEDDPSTIVPDNLLSGIYVDDKSE